MEIRIIAGKLKGRRIKISGGASCIRPTTEFVRKAVADSIQKRIPGAVVADVCAGTGAWGFEMVSRGAETVYFVDNNRDRCRTIQEHAHLFQVGAQCKIVCAEVARFIENCPCLFDIVYYDPPYDDATLSENVPRLLSCVTTEGMVIYEHGKDATAHPERMPGIIRTKRYGRTEVDFITVASPA